MTDLGDHDAAISVFTLAGIRSRDLTLEFWSAGEGVEWASALGANLFPVATEGYSEEVASEMIAALLAGRARGRVPTLGAEVHAVLDGILSLNNDIPVVPFASEFGSGDIQRLRGLVLRMAQWNQDPEYLRDAIERFNAEVRQVERRPELLRALKLEALLPAMATAALPATSPMMAAIKQYGPLGVWMASAALLMVAEPLLPKSAALSSLLDFLNGVLARQSQEAVLVSRVKKQIKVLKG